MEQIEINIPREIPTPNFARNLAGQVHQVQIPKAVRRRARSPIKIKVSDWADLFRIVPEGAQRGKWRHEFAPHTVKIMDTYGQAWVREVWFCGVEQSGKTNTMINCLSWAIDCDPGNAFYLMPTEKASDKVVGQKIKPTLLESPRLFKYLSKKQDDTTKERIALNNGMTIYPAWANSPTSLATFTAKHTFGDEIDKYPALSGSETDPITLLEKRTRNYKGRYKRFYGSTPAGLFIHKGLLACLQVWEFRVYCPDCGEYIKMDPDHLVIQDGATADDLEIVHYSCNGCGVVWGDVERESAIRSGRWYCIKGETLARPSRVGFHHTAFECLDVSLVEIGRAKLKAAAGDLAARIAWANGYLAIDYKEELTAKRETDQILKFRSDYPRNLVPLGTAELILLVDTQQDHFYYELFSIGYAPDLDLHLVRHGIVQQFNDLDYILEEVFEDPDGVQFKVQDGLIDSGGTRRGWQKHSRTVEVYEWCRKQPRIKPLKGVWARRDGNMIAYKTVETFPGTGKRIPGGLVRIDVKVDIFKDDLARLLAIEPDDPGALSFHNEVEENFARHYTAEAKDEKTGDWIHDKKIRNDYFDCNVYALVLREILRTRIPNKGQSAQRGRRILSKGVNNG